MKYLFSTLFFVSAAFNVFTMEKTTPEIEQRIQKKAVEVSSAHAEKILELETRLAACDTKIKELEQQVQNQSIAPLAPPLIASTKLPTPPAPEKPSQTFFQKHKKGIIITAGITSAGILLYKLNTHNTPKDYYAENAR